MANHGQTLSAERKSQPTRDCVPASLRRWLRLQRLRSWRSAKKNLLISAFVVTVGLWLGAFLGLYVVAGLFFVPAPMSAVEAMALFGDAMGTLNVLFSGLALAAVAVSIWFQREDIQHQLNEMARSHQEARQQTEAANEQVDVLKSQRRDAQIAQARATVIDLYNEFSKYNQVASTRYWLRDQVFAMHTGRSAEMSEWMGHAFRDGGPSCEEASRLVREALRSDVPNRLDGLQLITAFWVKCAALDEMESLDRHLFFLLLSPPLSCYAAFVVDNLIISNIAGTAQHRDLSVHSALDIQKREQLWMVSSLIRNNLRGKLHETTYAKISGFCMRYRDDYGVRPTPHYQSSTDGASPSSTSDSTPALGPDPDGRTPRSPEGSNDSGSDR